MTFRTCRRAIALMWALLVCRVRLAAMSIRGPISPPQRALWLQSACRGVLAGLGIQSTVQGTSPSRGLVVSNHLSYLDILIYSAAMPCAFVSKIEVDRWPYFGAAARAGGTIFINRRSRLSAAAVSAEMSQRLKLPVPVLLFPEGTSTDGSNVLPFHSSLFEPAVQSSAPITVAAVRYEIKNGLPERELCWFGDAPFLPHLWKALGTPGFHAHVVFGDARVYSDRKSAAIATENEVRRLRGLAPRAPAVTSPAEQPSTPAPQGS